MLTSGGTAGVTGVCDGVTAAGGALVAEELSAVADTL